VSSRTEGGFNAIDNQQIALLFGFLVLPQGTGLVERTKYSVIRTVNEIFCITLVRVNEVEDPPTEDEAPEIIWQATDGRHLLRFLVIPYNDKWIARKPPFQTI
jgi:hypothetical protein